MRNILYILPVILFLFVSCNSDRVKELEERNKELQKLVVLLKDKKVQEGALNDSIFKMYWDLREKVTRHYKTYYEVTDKIVRDDIDNEWSLSEFISDYAEDYGYIDKDYFDEYASEHGYIFKDEIIEYIINNYSEEDVKEWFDSRGYGHL